MSHKHKHRKHSKMHSLEEIDSLYLSTEPPINPQNGSREFLRSARSTNHKNHKGFLFYEKIRNYLPEWWESFNGDLDNHGRLKFPTVRSFIKSKTKTAQEISWLYQMIGPVSKHDDMQVPWLGDWEKRRTNGWGMLATPAKLKPLLKVIKENLSAAESVRALAPFLSDNLIYYTNLEQQVHEAFAGRAFVNGVAADHKKNTARFDVYKKMLAAVLELKVKVVHELMRVYGVDPDTPQQMRDMVQMAGGIGAAGALTGIAAAQQLPPGFGGQINTPNGPVIAPFTYDAMKLAEQLTKHAHTFKKPLPTTIEADPSSFEDDSSNTKHKGNGKVV